MAIIWGIQNQRNCIILKNALVDAIKNFTMVQMKVWAWINYKFLKSNFSYSDQCPNLYVCLNFID